MRRRDRQVFRRLEAAFTDCDAAIQASFVKGVISRASDGLLYHDGQTDDTRPDGLLPALLVAMGLMLTEHKVTSSGRCWSCAGFGWRLSKPCAIYRHLYLAFNLTPRELRTGLGAAARAFALPKPSAVPAVPGQRGSE